MEQDEQYQKWLKERAYVIEQKETLKPIHKENYIAVLNQQVIDSDKDEFVLTKRVYEKYPQEFVLVGSIEDIVNPQPVFLESPEGVEDIK
ncbi:MAG: hypothetical protein WC438_02960 [Candidatus Pacearchaeota archaeon]